VRLLVDTHVVLWWLLDDPTLPADVKDMLDHEPDAFLSAATTWEVAIKQATGKLKGPRNLPEQLRDSGLVELPIKIEHSIVAGRLPRLHNDPFDRMLIAQALHDELTLVTRDAEIQRYKVPVLAV
jgi:PIN domain nuclease of toxin-antitoxin system